MSETKKPVKRPVKFAKRILLIVILLLVAFVCGIFWKGHNPSKTVTNTVTEEQIKEEVSAISEWATLEYAYTNVGKFENTIDFYGWNVPFTTKSFIITYNGIMKLGVDMDQLEISIDGNVIYITMPQAEVLSHVIDESSLEVLDETKNIFNPIQIEDYTGFATEEKQVMEAKARSNGLFLDAENRTKDQLKAFIEGSLDEGQDYTVKFIDSTVSSTATDPSSETSQTSSVENAEASSLPANSRASA